MFLLFFAVILLCGCTNRSDLNVKKQISTYGVSYGKVENTQGFLINICEDFDCMVGNFKNCKEFQTNENKIIYVVFGYNEKDDKCDFLLDKKSLQQNSMECFFKKADLTENLFKNLRGDASTEKEQQIIKDNCKEIKI